MSAPWLCLLLLASTPEKSPAFDQARTAFLLGLEHLDARRWRRAAGAFERSLALRESPPALYNLAIARGHLQQPTAAITALERFIQLVGADPKTARARALIVKQRAQLVRVSLRVRGAAERLWVDGEAHAIREEVALVLDPGVHTFAVERRGYARVERSLELEPGATVVTLRADVKPLPARLRVQAQPGAELLIDGRLAGKGAYEGELAPGAYRLSIQAEDHLPQHKRLKLLPGQALDLKVHLRPQPLRLAQRWWFWAGIGAVVIAGVTAGVVVGTRSSTPLDPGDLDRVLLGVRAQ